MTAKSGSGSCNCRGMLGFMTYDHPSSAWRGLTVLRAPPAASTAAAGSCCSRSRDSRRPRASPLRLPCRLQSHRNLDQLVAALHAESNGIADLVIVQGREQAGD